MIHLLSSSLLLEAPLQTETDVRDRCQVIRSTGREAINLGLIMCVGTAGEIPPCYLGADVGTPFGVPCFFPASYHVLRSSTNDMQA